MWRRVGLVRAETSAFTKPTRRHVPEDAILRSYRRENLKSYTVMNVRVL
jgi:hypothetical protein